MAYRKDSDWKSGTPQQKQELRDPLQGSNELGQMQVPFGQFVSWQIFSVLTRCLLGSVLWHQANTWRLGGGFHFFIFYPETWNMIQDDQHFSG